MAVQSYGHHLENYIAVKSLCDKYKNVEQYYYLVQCQSEEDEC